MNQYSSYKFDDFECSGPRPPVPGEESRRHKMTEVYSSEKNRDSPPTYLKWAHKLSNLLEDGDGAELFKRYVELEGGVHSNRLKFYFACEGLKQQTDPEKVKQLIGAIYRKFLKRSLPGSELYVPESLRNFIKAGLKNELILTSDVFDQMQHDVARIISETTYPNFLQSDLYVQFIQNIQNVGCGGPLSSQTSSSSASELVSHSSALPTLHEDSELATADSIEQLYGAIGPGIGSASVASATGSIQPKSPVAVALTKDALMATQRRRLEMRPPGVHGYSVYTAYASYNPVSRRDSELASLSSGRTDSDTMSMSSISTDGRPHSQRRHHHHHHHSSIERRLMRENAITNEETNTFAIIPRTQRYTQQPLPQDEFAKILLSKLEAVHRDQEKNELLTKKLQDAETFDKTKSNKSLADAIREKLLVDDDNDQDILDQHVSRVWSDLTPSRSPGAMSPCPLPMRRRGHEIGFGPGISAQSSMRHSKSMPEGQQMPPPIPASRKLGTKWPSVNTDSGISLFSTDTLTKYKDQSANSSRPLSRTMVADGSSNTTVNQLEETRRRLEDESRRSKRYQQQHPLPSQIQQMQLPPPPLPPQATSLSLVPPPIPAKPQPQEFTTVVYSFCDEEVPYRIKIPGTQPPTLKQFKDYLPKKGNYRFFFKTRCDDIDNPVIQEEINNDTETLPLFEGKVMGTVKPSE